MDVEQVDNGLVEWGAHYGCGRKVRPGDLERIGDVVTRPGNAGLPQVEGLFLLSDAGVSRLGEDLLVQTVDVILPLPISAEVWGCAAALHCLSDLYAAGGRPLTAVGVLQVGLDDQSRNLVMAGYEAAGGALNDAGVALVGGHSLRGQVSKIGFTITGVAKPEEVRAVCNARPGDLVYLTKPIGVGAALAHIGATGVRPQEYDEIERTLLTSNAGAAAVATRAGLRCVTDVSGYGLLGALLQVADASKVSITVDYARVPRLESGERAIRKGVVSALAEAVWLESTERIGGLAATDTEVRLLLADPQVSGGLVLFVPDGQQRDLEEQAGDAGVAAELIGSVSEQRSEAVTVTG